MSREYTGGRLHRNFGTQPRRGLRVSWRKDIVQAKGFGARWYDASSLWLWKTGKKVILSDIVNTIVKSYDAVERAEHPEWKPLSRVAVLLIVQKFLKITLDALVDGRVVRLKGFGDFCPVYRPSYTTADDGQVEKYDGGTYGFVPLPPYNFDELFGKLVQRDVDPVVLSAWRDYLIRVRRNDMGNVYKAPFDTKKRQRKLKAYKSRNPLYKEHLAEREANEKAAFEEDQARFRGA